MGPTCSKSIPRIFASFGRRVSCESRRITPCASSGCSLAAATTRTWSWPPRAGDLAAIITLFRWLKKRGLVQPATIEELVDHKLPTQEPPPPTYYTRAEWQTIMTELSQAVGIEATPHKSRRTFTTWALRAGVPAPTVARWLGHADLTMLYRHYLAHIPAYDPAVERLSSVA